MMSNRFFFAKWDILTGIFDQLITMCKSNKASIVHKLLSDFQVSELTEEQNVIHVESRCFLNSSPPTTSPSPPLLLHFCGLTKRCTYTATPLYFHNVSSHVLPVPKFRYTESYNEIRCSESTLNSSALVPVDNPQTPTWVQHDANKRRFLSSEQIICTAVRGGGKRSMNWLVPSPSGPARARS